MQKIIIKTLFIIILILLQANTSTMNARHCQDYIVFDGGEQLIGYGIDSTGNWWAVTAPFADSYRVIVNGDETGTYFELKELTFSPDGERWAFFGRNNVGWHLVKNDEIISLPGTDVGKIVFSGNSKAIAYSYKEVEQEIIILGNRELKVFHRAGDFYVSYDGRHIAFMGLRGQRLVLNINGQETPLFDNIKPMGFWYDGSFIYAASSGNLWEVYKNNQAISEIYHSISDVAINNQGTVAAVLAVQSSGQGVGILFSDEYYEPLIGKPYDIVGDLELHPTEPLFAYYAEYNQHQFIVMNTVEYSGGEETSAPFFTHCGSEVYFTGCRINCFVNVNGRQINVRTQLYTDIKYAKKPFSNTIAYSTSSTMVVQTLDDGELYAGMMVDEIIQPIYNWKTNRYETLGRINQRLYLLTCTF